MARQFSELDLKTQMEIAVKVGAAMKRHDINAKVDLYREEVCQFTGEDVKGRMMLKVEKVLPSVQKEKAEKFNADEEVKKIKEEYGGVSISVSTQLGAGDDYQVITNVTTIEDPNTKVNLDHTPGKVMFIDFWATWCPPCQKPMQHNQDMLNEHGAKWGDNV